MILVGRAGRDPEITHIPNMDRDVAKFSIATTEVFKDRNTNDWQEHTEWHNIVAWGFVAKKVERSVSKGTLVLVEGKLKTRKWKDKNDMERRTTEIQADTVTPLEKPNRESSYGGGGTGSQGGYSPPPAGPQGGGGGYPDPYQSQQQQQAPPEMQIDDINDIPYDDSDPF